MTDASRRLADLITNILKLNKLENQQIYPEREVFDLGEQLCECLLAFEDVWEEKGIELDTDLAEDMERNPLCPWHCGRCDWYCGCLCFLPTV